MTHIENAQRWLRAPAATAAAAVLLVTAAAVAAGVARAAGHQPAIVTVTATPRDAAAAQITTATGTITPPWGQPVRLDQQPETVSVITWADRGGASCTIWFDGRVVAESTTGAEGQPASCVWPE